MPGPLGIAVPLLLSLMVCILLAGRRLSITRLSVSVIASQTLFHTLFGLRTPTGEVRHSASLAGHNHGQQLVSVPVVSDHTTTLLYSDALMSGSHLLGAVITIAFLFRGERAIHHMREVAEQFVTWVGRRFTAPLRLPVTTAPVLIRIEDADPWSVLSQIHASTVSRRGPPARVRIAR